MNKKEKTETGGENKRPMKRDEMEKFMAAQQAEILSPENLWLAGVDLGHQPNRQEAAQHYINHGGAEKFREKWENQKR